MLLVLGLGGDHRVREHVRTVVGTLLLLLVDGEAVGVVVLLADGPGVGEAGVVRIVGVDELRHGAGAVPRRSAIAEGGAAAAHEALVHQVVVAGLGTVEREDEDDLLGGVQVALAVVKVVLGEGIAAFVHDDLGILVSLLVPLVAVLFVGHEELAVPVAVVVRMLADHQVGGGVLLETAQPGVVVQEHLGRQHAGGVLVHTAVLLGGRHVGNAFFHFLGQEIPDVLGSALLRQVTGLQGVGVADFQRDVAPQVEEDEVVEGADGADFGEGFLVLDDGLGLQELVGLHDAVVAVVPFLPEVRNARVRVVLVQVDVLGAPAAVGAVRGHDQVGTLLVDVEVALPGPVHEAELDIEVAQHILDLVVGSGQVVRGQGGIDVLVQVGAGRSRREGDGRKDGCKKLGDGFHIVSSLITCCRK